MIDVLADGLFELRDAFEHAVANPVVGNVPKPALDDIEPRTAGRDEVNVESLVSLQPTLDLRMLVRGVVVDDEVQIEVWRRFRIDLLEEPDPLLVSMSRQTLGDDPALRQFDGCKQ